MSDKYAEVRQKCIDYFGSDHWMFIKHPRLGYECPSVLLREGRDVEKVEALVNDETGPLYGSKTGVIEERNPIV